MKNNLNDKYLVEFCGLDIYSMKILRQIPTLGLNNYFSRKIEKMKQLKNGTIEKWNNWKMEQLKNHNKYQLILWKQQNFLQKHLNLIDLIYVILELFVYVLLIEWF